MAGSYNHCIDHDGKLLTNEDLVRMLENGGDVFEAVEELYGMIWYLAVGNPGLVEIAHEHYEEGLTMSPGVDGELPDDEDD